MGQTRSGMITRIQTPLGKTDTAFTTYLETSLDNMLFTLWDMHDWNFKHKTGSFSTVAGTESYDLTSSIADLRSSEDIEVLYDSTNGQVLQKVDLKEIRQSYPKEDTSGKPTYYAPWGKRTIYLGAKPDGIYTIKALYLSKPTLTTGSGDLESVCGLPDYMQPLLEKMVFAEALAFIDDTRYAATLEIIEKIMLPNAIRADMRHVESNARIKNWQEELANSGGNYSDYLKQWWWGDN